MSILKGIVVPIITPLRERNQDKIDGIALEELCNFLISKGINGLFPCGTTGEGYLLSKGIRKELASQVVRNAKGRVPTVIQTGCIETKSTIELTKHARDVGADGAAIVTPYFYHYDFDCLKRHFIRVAESVPGFPIYLYNIPGNTNNNITPELLRAVINEADNIVGIKYTHIDLRRIPEYLTHLGEGRVFLMGNDQLIYPSYLLGASGSVSANANVFPEPFVRLYDALSTRDYLRAKQEQELIRKICHILRKGKYVCYYKTALQFRGIEVGGTILPQKELNKEEIVSFYEELESLHLPLDNLMH